MADARIFVLVGSLALLSVALVWPTANTQAYTTTVIPSLSTMAGMPPVAIPVTAIGHATNQPQSAASNVEFTAAAQPSIGSAAGALFPLAAFTAAATALMTYFMGRKSSAHLPLLPLVEQVSMAATLGRREALVAAGAAGAGLAVTASPAKAERIETLCDEECLQKLESIPRVKTASGLEYQDIVVGTGPSPQTGFQVTFHLIGMLTSGRVYLNTLKERAPLDIRVGANSMLKGLDEGLLTMKAGGIRRLYVPGDLSYPTSMKAAPGQPAIPARTPVVFDVQLLLVPGLEEEPEDEGNVFEGLF